MEQPTIRGLQDEAMMAYNRLPQSEAAGYLQAAMSAEVALQLQVQNEALLRIAATLESIFRHGLSVENVHG